MTVRVAGLNQQPGLGEIATFADPAVGTDFSVTVPTGEAWRLWGGSCRIAGSATVTNRTPCLYFKHGDIYVYAASNGASYTANANQIVVFYVQDVMQANGPPFLTGAGETWFLATNPPSLVYNPIGVRPIWLPAGTVLRYWMQNMQPGDQMSQVGMLVEKVIL